MTKTEKITSLIDCVVSTYAEVIKDTIKRKPFPYLKLFSLPDKLKIINAQTTKD
jgi:hypothetical protein